MKREEIARYAYENVPFYRELLSEKPVSWGDYPIVDKQMILARMDAVFSPEYMGDLMRNELDRVLTSGSTGDCLEVFWKREQNTKSLIALWRKRMKYYGISPSDRRCYFFTTKIVNGEELEVEKTRFGLGFSKADLSEEKIIAIYHMMREFNPKWMIVQPSMILLMLNVIKRRKLKPFAGLTYIELTGERITDTDKRFIEEYFRCRVASQYGCYETNSIAYECPYGGLHVMTENVFAEVIGEEDLCITSLHNKVMPFVRYKIGDKGRVIHNHDCPCGSKEPVIELRMARENDWIYNSDGTVSHSDIFCNIVDKINLLLQQVIKQFQIIQIDYHTFKAYLVIDEEEAAGEIQKLFIENYEKYQERIEITFFFVDYLFPSEKTGKLAWFSSNMKGEIV